MTAFATLLVLAFFAYLIYAFAPGRADRAWRIERFRAPGPLADRTPSYYENQRQYSDLAAIHGHRDAPDPELRDAVTEARSVVTPRPVHLRKTGLVNGNVSAPGGTLAV